MLGLSSRPVDEIASNHRSVGAYVAPDGLALMSAAIAVSAALANWFNDEMVVVHDA